MHLSHLKSLHLGDFEAISDNAGVQSLGDVSVGLLEQLSHQQDNRGCSITTNIVLSGRSTCDHDCRGVLNLHLSEKNISVLGELDLLAKSVSI